MASNAQRIRHGRRIWDSSSDGFDDSEISHLTNDIASMECDHSNIEIESAESKGEKLSDVDQTLWI